MNLNNKYQISKKKENNIMDIKIQNEFKDALIQVTIKYVDKRDKDEAVKKVDIIISKILQQFENEFNQLFEIETI